MERVSDLVHFFFMFCFRVVYVDCLFDRVNGWFYYQCRFQRAKPVIVDPGLFLTKKSDVFWITQRRSVPTAFKLFTGKLGIYCLWLSNLYLIRSYCASPTG